MFKLGKLTVIFLISILSVSCGSETEPEKPKDKELPLSSQQKTFCNKMAEFESSYFSASSSSAKSSVASQRRSWLNQFWLEDSETVNDWIGKVIWSEYGNFEEFTVAPCYQKLKFAGMAANGSPLWTSQQEPKLHFGIQNRKEDGMYPDARMKDIESSLSGLETDMFVKFTGAIRRCEGGDGETHLTQAKGFANPWFEISSYEAPSSLLGSLTCEYIRRGYVPLTMTLYKP
jgi:hypothetical protein